MSVRSDKINATYLALSDYGLLDKRRSKKRKAKKSSAQHRKGKICARCSKDTPLALDIMSLYDFNFCPWCGRKLSPVA